VELRGNSALIQKGKKVFLKIKVTDFT